MDLIKDTIKKIKVKPQTDKKKMSYISYKIKA